MTITAFFLVSKENPGTEPSGAVQMTLVGSHSSNKVADQDQKRPVLVLGGVVITLVSAAAPASGSGSGGDGGTDVWNNWDEAMACVVQSKNSCLSMQ